MVNCQLGNEKLQPALQELLKLSSISPKPMKKAFFISFGLTFVSLWPTEVFG
jgi:hypothetical protein